MKSKKMKKQTIIDTEKIFFSFLNNKNINYVVTRGFDKESKDNLKDLDILISNEDYKKIKSTFPKINRPIDFYLDEEKHFGIIFLSKESLDRKTFDKSKGFFILSEKDKRRMNFFRRILKFGRKVKGFFGFYKKKDSSLKIIKRNLKFFGIKYVLIDFIYQFFRLINKKFQTEKSLPKKIIKKRINDYELFINSNGKGIHRDLTINSIREPISTKIVNSLLKEGDVVLEAGANIGYYAILESKRVGEKGLVYAVEPSKENFNLLNKNIQLNGLKNIKTFNLGFNKIEGIINLNISKDSNLNTPMEIKNPLRVEKVRGTTIDNFFKNKKKPSFMRMDIEGFEDNVFYGANKTLDYLENIFVELHFPLLGKERMTNLLIFLKNKGFEIDSFVIEWERLESEKNLLGNFVNYLYKKRSKPKIIKNIKIDQLIKNKDYLEGHLSLEVFFKKHKK